MFVCLTEEEASHTASLWGVLSYPIGEARQEKPQTEGNSPSLRRVGSAKSHPSSRRSAGAPPDAATGPGSRGGLRKPRARGGHQARKREQTGERVAGAAFRKCLHSPSGPACGPPLRPGSGRTRPGPRANLAAPRLRRGAVGARGAPPRRSGPSPSYLGSGPSVGKSMAGGAGRAPASSPSASRPGASGLPPSIAGPARAAAQHAHRPSAPCSAPAAIAKESGSSPSRAEVPPRTPLQGAAPPLWRTGRAGVGVRVGWSWGCPAGTHHAGTRPALPGAPPRCPRDLSPLR